MEFALSRGQRAWALLRLLCLAALVRGFCFAGGDEEESEGGGAEAALRSTEPSPEGPAAAPARGDWGEGRGAGGERIKKPPEGTGGSWAGLRACRGGERLGAEGRTGPGRGPAAQAPRGWPPPALPLPGRPAAGGTRVLGTAGEKPGKGQAR